MSSKGDEDRAKAWTEWSDHNCLDPVSRRAVLMALNAGFCLDDVIWMLDLPNGLASVPEVARRLKPQAVRHVA